MPAGGLTWSWHVLAPLKHPAFLSVKLSHRGKGDECWQTPVLHLLWLFSLSPPLGSLLGKTCYPLLSLMLFWAHMVGVQATFLMHFPDGRGLQFLCYTSGTLTAGWQICLPQSPALGGPASHHDESTSLLLSAWIQWHL